MTTTETDRPDIVSRLRDATGDAHARLEARLDILERLSESDGRRRIVAGFFGLHAGAEPVLAPWLIDLPGLDFASRDRAPILADDLAALGLDEAAVPICPVDPPACTAEALGFFYVLEGSTLGGKMIRREMEKRGASPEGLAFLDPYGPETGTRWRAFLDVLRAAAPDDEATEAVVRGGIAGFARAETWLCGTA